MGESRRSYAKLFAQSRFMVFGLVACVISLSLQIEPFDEYRYAKLISWIVGGLGTTLFTVGIVSLIYENTLRKEFLDDMEKTIEKVFEDRFQHYLDSHLRQMIEEQIDQNTIPYYKRLYANGIRDSFYGLDYRKLKNRISTLNTKLCISKIWLDSFSELEDAIIQAITNGCHVQINLLAPSSDEAIVKRANSGGRLEPTDITGNILKSVRTLMRIHNNLDDECKPRLELRLHKSFISIAYYQCGEDVLIGLYLHGKLSNAGTIIKVDGHRRFGQELQEHFRLLWEENSDKFDLSNKEEYANLAEGLNV